MTYSINWPPRFQSRTGDPEDPCYIGMPRIERPVSPQLLKAVQAGTLDTTPRSSGELKPGQRFAQYVQILRESRREMTSDELAEMTGSRRSYVIEALSKAKRIGLVTIRKVRQHDGRRRCFFRAVV